VGYHHTNHEQAHYLGNKIFTKWGISVVFLVDLLVVDRGEARRKNNWRKGIVLMAKWI
jgi:hypothetical protein